MQLSGMQDIFSSLEMAHWGLSKAWLLKSKQAGVCRKGDECPQPLCLPAPRQGQEPGLDAAKAPLHAALSVPSTPRAGSALPETLTPQSWTVWL